MIRLGYLTSIVFRYRVFCKGRRRHAGRSVVIGILGDRAAIPIKDVPAPQLHTRPRTSDVGKFADRRLQTAVLAEGSASEQFVRSHWIARCNTAFGRDDVIYRQVLFECLV